MEKRLLYSGDYRIENLIDINDLSAVTKIKVCTLRKYILTRTIPFVKIGGKVRFRLSEIDIWLKSLSHTPEERRIKNRE
jgi:excisionase family DNA binding protein